jgi:hypothetical protein
VETHTKRNEYRGDNAKDEVQREMRGKNTSTEIRTYIAHYLLVASVTGTVIGKDTHETE